LSLTSFLNNKHVKERFRQEFKKPKFGLKKELLAPPISNRYSLVGTAFDYLFRFYLERLNANVITYEWFVDSSFSSTMSPFISDLVIDVDTKQSSYEETELGKKARSFIDIAKSHYRDYLASGQITDELLESVLIISQIEMMRRSGRPDDNLGIAHTEDISDLRNLIAIVEPEQFRSEKLCLLNPSFGAASKLVGGADADLLIDETLIDIKTTKNLQLKVDDFYQLLGYVILNDISGAGELSPKPTTSQVAIYYARHAYLHIMNLDEIISRETYSGFVNWFAITAENIRKTK
jgi:hypothetical protein